MKMALDDDFIDAEQVVADSPQLDTMETVARLAAMSPIDYDRVREVEADRLKVRVSTLDREVAMARGRGHQNQAGDGEDDFLVDPEPWPEPVHGADLLDRMTDLIASYLVLPKCAPEAIALWIMHAHTHDCFGISPILAVTSPTPECGKTTSLTLIGGLVPRALPASNITTAALFRAVEKWRPTLLIDEADTFLNNSDEMRGVLNSGHQRANAFVIRTVGDDHAPKRFRTWSPKVIALIGKLAATLASRAIHIELRRKTVGEMVRPLRADRLDHLRPLCRQAARWAEDNASRISTIDPDMPTILSGRAADNWRPLIAIADVIGGHWPARARRVAEELGGSRSEQSNSIMLLEDIQQIFATEGVDRIPSQELASKLANIEERPWVEWKNGKPITPRQIAKLLEPFKVKPDSVRIGTATPKGYMLEDFADAFGRYTPSESATPQQCSKTADFGPISPATRSPSVADQKSEKSSQINDCCGVADQRPLNGPVEQSIPTRCALCGDFDLPGDALGPFGIDPHTWLHQRCWPEWRNQNSNGSAAPALKAAGAAGIDLDIDGDDLV